MRDKLIHEYFGVIYERVWETVKRDIPQVKPLIEEILDIMKKNKQEKGIGLNNQHICRLV